jgi:hypothetical protein
MTRFVRILGLLLVLQAAGGAAYKLLEGRIDDLPHTVLHLGSGLVAVWASAPRRDRTATRRFAVAFGSLYLLLGFLGVAHAPPSGTLHLKAADHVFHAVVGTVTLVVGMRACAPEAACVPASA